MGTLIIYGAMLLAVVALLAGLYAYARSSRPDREQRRGSSRRIH